MTALRRRFAVLIVTFALGITLSACAGSANSFNAAAASLLDYIDASNEADANDQESVDALLALTVEPTTSRTRASIGAQGLGLIPTFNGLRVSHIEQSDPSATEDGAVVLLACLGLSPRSEGDTDLDQLIGEIPDIRVTVEMVPSDTSPNGYAVRDFGDAVDDGSCATDEEVR